jgi:hypothetical protein
MTFIDELLAEAEVKEKEERLEMSKLRADQVLAALSVLEQKAAEVNSLADDGTKLIEEFRQSGLQKLEKKASWLEWNLEQFIRSTDEKTINLPHGTLKLRLGRDKVQIADVEKFMKAAPSKNLLRTVPESFEPDMQKVLSYLKQNGHLPGVLLIPAQTKFSYITKGNNTNGEAEQPETRTEAQ